MKNLLFLFILLAFSCSDTDPDIVNIPDCVKDIRDEGALVAVDHYTKDNQDYFLLIYNCCDWFDELMDGKCTYICAPSGGIAGTGDGLCPDFSTDYEFKEQLWKL